MTDRLAMIERELSRLSRGIVAMSATMISTEDSRLLLGDIATPLWERLLAHVGGCEVKAGAGRGSRRLVSIETHREMFATMEQAGKLGMAVEDLLKVRERRTGVAGSKRESKGEDSPKGRASR